MDQTTNEIESPRPKVLVTGGGGFLGSAIIERLVARGDAVRSLSRSHYPNLANMGVDQIQGAVGAVEAVLVELGVENCEPAAA